MAKVSGEQWGRQQEEVWGDKDPEVFRRVQDRIRQQEIEVVREVGAMLERGVSANAIVNYVTNAILRGVDEVEYGPPGQTWDPRVRRWVDDGPTTGPADNWNRPTGA